MESIRDKILNRLVGYKKGRILFPNDFAGLGSNHAINMALSRLAKENKLVCIAYGIYLYPRYDTEFGLLYPSFEELAKEIAKRDKAIIRPTGAYALHQLGLSNQIPMKVVYYTSGSQRNIKLDNREISFKHTAPKNMAAKGKYTRLVIPALRELGKEGANENVINRITEVLSNEKIKTIAQDAKSAPAWIAAILFSIIKKLEKNGKVAPGQ